MCSHVETGSCVPEAGDRATKQGVGGGWTGLDEQKQRVSLVKGDGSKEGRFLVTRHGGTNGYIDVDLGRGSHGRGFRKRRKSSGKDRERCCLSPQGSFSSSTFPGVVASVGLWVLTSVEGLWPSRTFYLRDGAFLFPPQGHVSFRLPLCHSSLLGR